MRTGMTCMKSDKPPRHCPIRLHTSQTQQWAQLLTLTDSSLVRGRGRGKFLDTYSEYMIALRKPWVFTHFSLGGFCPGSAREE